LAATFALSRHDLTGEVTIRYWRTIAVSLAALLSALPLGIEGVLDSRLPVAIEPTISSRYGSYAVVLMLVLSIILVGRRRLRA